MAASKVGESMSDLVYKYLRFDGTFKFMLKRSYDDWFFKQLFADRRRRSRVKSQKLRVDEHSTVGSDLAVSRFVVERCRGQIRDERGLWIFRKSELPADYRQSFKVTGIKMIAQNLVTEGVDNFVDLDHLELIDLSDNPKLDDFACDQLSRQFRRSKNLKEVILNNNPLISVYGLEILFRIPSLRRIVAFNTQASNYEDIDLFTVAAEEERKCTVLVHEDGRQYNSSELEALRFELEGVPKLASH